MYGCFKVVFSFLKGQCQEIFSLVFFIKQLLLDMRRNDFEFFRMFEELFVFVIDSPVYSPPGNQTPRCIHLLWSHEYTGELPKLVYKKSCWCKIHHEVETALWLIHGEFYSLVFLSPESFVVNLFWRLFSIHREVDSLEYSSPKSQIRITPRIFE